MRVSQRITLTLCSVEVLGLAGFASFAALLPDFIQVWRLSNTEAGWLSAVYYGAYVLAVPLLTAWTDRRDARLVLLIGLGAGVTAALGFAWAAQGFWTAAAFRFLSGVSLAGLYMPGLKLLSDHTEGPRQTRYVAFYTASFSIGASLSYFMTGEINTLLGWRWAFSAAGIMTLSAFGLVLGCVPRGRTTPAGLGWPRGSDLRLVLRSRQAMAFVLGYTGHMWELFSMRAWMVAFLTYSRQLQGAESLGLSPTQVVALVNLIGLPASIGGNEWARRGDRRQVVVRVMLVSFALSAVLGFAAGAPYPLLVGLCLVYGVLVLGDSAALTAGAVSSAPAGARGMTLAVHSTLGFGAAFFGPLATGVVLDIFQGQGAWTWGLAFLTMGAGSALGPLAMRCAARRPKPGD